MLEMLLCTVSICLAICYTVCWLMKREIVSLQDKLAEAKADEIKSVEEFTKMQNKMREACLQVTKERDQIKMDLDYAQECYWGEAETAYHLRCSRTIIIEHCRKLKRANGHDRFARKIEIDCANGKVEEMKKERDHARKLMDESRERCGAEIDVIEDTIRDLQRQKSIAENRGEQLHGENNRLRKDKVRLLSDSKMLRQSRQKIIDHCRKINRDQKKFIRMTDYILDELATINTSR